MNWVHIHLMTNHAPVIGIIVGLVLWAVAMAWKSQDLKRFALYYFVALGAVSLLVFLTGEPAEEAVEHAAGISEAVIERHEEASVFGLIAIELLALASLAGILFGRRQLLSRQWYSVALTVLALFSAATMGWVANLGGKIRHTEIDQVQAAGETGESD